MVWKFICSLFQVLFQGHMFWRLFGKESPLLDSALEGIVFKEGKGRFYGRLTKKKRLLAYDEVAKCLRYYTLQRSLKGSIHLHDILFITPGRSSGKDVKKDSVFEITIPGRVYVFHVHNIRETRKWIGILSRELDSLKIRDRIQLNNGNITEGTYSKTLRPNSAILSAMKIGEHREHEECCFLFDEEHQHRIIALESLCSLQAMKIYELAHHAEKTERKCAELEVPPSEEIKRMKDQYNKLRVSFEREKLQVLDLKAKIEEEEEHKLKEQDKQMVRKVEKHQHMDFGSQVVKVMQIERSETPKTLTSQKRNIAPANSFVNIPNSDKNRMEEIKRLQEELDNTKALLARERARALENPLSSVNFNSSSPLFFDTRSSSSTGSITPNRSPAATTRTSTPSNLSSSSKLQSIPENTPINPKLGSYRTFSPSLDNHVPHPQRDASPQLSIHPPSSPQQLRMQPHSTPSHNNGTDISPILSPQPRYAILQNSSLLDSPITTSPNPANNPPPPPQILSPPLIPQQVLKNTSTQSSDSTSSIPSFASFQTPTSSQNGLHSSNGISSNDSISSTNMLEDFNVVSITSTNSTTISSIKPVLQNSGGISKDFNMAQHLVTKPRSNSESGSSPLKHATPMPNGKIEVVNKSTPEIISPRSRTNSNPTPFKYATVSSVRSITTSFDSVTVSSKGSEVSSHPDDNGLAMQVMTKLNEAMAEIAALTTQLHVEREKAKSLAEEKEHMLDTMEEMTAERMRNQRSKDEMEDLMETKEGKITALREALEMEIKLRMEVEGQLVRAQAALQQSILHDEMPANTAEILQPLLTNYSH